MLCIIDVVKLFSQLSLFSASPHTPQVTLANFSNHMLKRDENNAEADLRHFLIAYLKRYMEPLMWLVIKTEPTITTLIHVIVLYTPLFANQA